MNELSDEEIMNQASIAGLKLWILGILTCGIWPCIYWLWVEHQDRKKEKNNVV